MSIIWCYHAINISENLIEINAILVNAQCFDWNDNQRHPPWEQRYHNPGTRRESNMCKLTLASSNQFAWRQNDNNAFRIIRAISPVNDDEYNVLIETIIMPFRTIVRHHLTEADFNPDYIKQLNTDHMNNMPDEHMFELMKAHACVISDEFYYHVQPIRWLMKMITKHIHYIQWKRTGIARYSRSLLIIYSNAYGWMQCDSLFPV